jgi:hypothetical protein
VATLAVAAPAGAAVRLAAPNGSGASPCNPNPCSLSTAIKGASAGDQVKLEPGVYDQTGPIVIDKAIDVGGAPGAVPTISLGGVPFEVENAGATVHDLVLTVSEEMMQQPLIIRAGSVERILADPGGKSGEGCFMETGAIRDSLCLEGLSIGPYQSGPVQASVANVTANPLVIGASEGAELSATVVNTIAYARNEPGFIPYSLTIDVSKGSSADIVLRNSSYATVGSISSGNEFTYTPPGTNGNQTALPQFVNAAGGDFRESAGSPTIDAGLSEPFIGASDISGAPRSQPSCIGGTPVPDIGAYEFTPTTVCPGLGSGPAPTSALPPKVGFGKLVRHPGKGTATLFVTVSSAGTLALKGKGIVGRRISAAGAGTVKVPVAAKGSRATKLRRTGKVKLRAFVTFTDKAGGTSTSARPLTLKLKRHK